jgi:hypothetical protein
MLNEARGKRRHAENRCYGRKRRVLCPSRGRLTDNGYKTTRLSAVFFRKRFGHESDHGGCGNPVRERSACLLSRRRIHSEMIRDLMVEHVETRFGTQHAIAFSRSPTLRARRLTGEIVFNRKPCFTSVERIESNSVAEAFGNIPKRD